MTQSAPSERAQTALKTSGMSGSPLMSLEREDALFVLTDDMLVYQDGGGTRRVTLRDLTRIHSDQAGLLRVETPAGTALTASLLGFDVGQVQTFFKGVRSATARAKDVPSSPTPTLGGAKTFGSEPAARNESAARNEPTARNEPDAKNEARTQPTQGESAGTQGSGKGTAPAGVRPSTASGPSTTAQATVPADAAGSPTGMSVRPKPPEPRQPEGNAENPVVISSSSFSPNVSKPGLSKVGAGAGGTGAGKTPPPPARTGPEAASPASVSPAKPDLSKAPGVAVVAAPEDTRKKTATAEVAAPAGARTEAAPSVTPRRTVAIPGAAPASPAEEKPTAQVPAVSPPVADEAVTDAPPTTALTRVAAATALARQAETVEALAGRLKILGAVLFVAALALAFFQFTGDQALAGLWTLLSGGVGAIALLALGELSGLLSLLARARND